MKLASQLVMPELGDQSRRVQVDFPCFHQGEKDVEKKEK